MDFLADQQRLLFMGVTLIAGVAIVFILLAMRANGRLVRELRGRLQSSEGELQELRPLREEVAVLRSEVTRLKEDEAENRRLTASLSEREAAYSAIRAENAKIEELVDSLKTELARVQGDLSTAQTERTEAKIERERIETIMRQERNAHEEKLSELGNVRMQIEKDLKILSDALMKENADAFLKRAGEYFEIQKKESHTGLETLVNPLNDVLKTYQEKLQEMEQNRKRDEGQIVEQLRTVAETHGRLHDTTANLVNALRSAPKTRGRWGEQQLRKVLEMAGMIEHVDFETEKSVDGDEGRLRPDVVLRLPGDRLIVVDAKTPMKAYLDAVEATDDAERERGLKEHAAQLRRHAMQLGSKQYWSTLPKAVDFVVMFVPGDNFYAAAIEQDADIFEDAYAKQVVISTPTTLLALAKAIAFGWRQEKVSQDAQKIVGLGNELYKRLVKMGDRLAAMSKSLNTTVDRHNEFVASLETRVLPQARKFQELGVGQNLAEIGDADPVELEVREAQADRDLEFGVSDEDLEDDIPALTAPEDESHQALLTGLEVPRIEADVHPVSDDDAYDDEAESNEPTLAELEAMGQEALRLETDWDPEGAGEPPVEAVSPWSMLSNLPDTEEPAHPGAIAASDEVAVAEDFQTAPAAMDAPSTMDPSAHTVPVAEAAPQPQENTSQQSVARGDEEDAELRALEAEIAELERQEQAEKDRAVAAGGASPEGNAGDQTGPTKTNPFEVLARDLEETAGPGEPMNSGDVKDEDDRPQTASFGR